eukprot:CAMPEP_0173168568 /NCGR_PEP_ID=MMETSP1141-20130122/223_1 /TAXON_ID=483371 /ORGANISM="non described non described, Strain CCMP2298" /LENGTH=345 /DNA_ID=CAMNT_0014090303 /DNA_START=128 /DNA_END=1162 /DNA_ORIENTATION=-
MEKMETWVARSQEARSQEGGAKHERFSGNFEAKHKEVQKTGVIMMSLKDIYPAFHIVRMIEHRLAARLYPTKYKLDAEDLETCLCECLWELALLIRTDQEEAMMAIDCDIIPAIDKIISHPTLFPITERFASEKECALSVLLELCRYRPCCCILASNEQPHLLRHICEQVLPPLGPATEQWMRDSMEFYSQHSQVLQAGLDMLGRLLGGLGEETALLKDVAHIVHSLVLSDSRLKGVRMLDRIVDMHTGLHNKWCNFEITVGGLQTATQAALEGESIGPKGWTSHYSMERDCMDSFLEKKEVQEKRQKYLEGMGSVEQMCSFCQEEGVGLKVCGACKQAYYCSVE